MNEELLEKTLLYIEERFKNDYSGHDYYHSIGVYKSLYIFARKKMRI